jgi:hypothetical protein
MSEASDTWRLNALHVTIDDKDREIERLKNQVSVLQHYRYGEADCLGCQDRDAVIDKYREALEKIATNYAIIDCRTWRDKMREIQEISKAALEI